MSLPTRPSLNAWLRLTRRCSFTTPRCVRSFRSCARCWSRHPRRPNRRSASTSKRTPSLTALTGRPPGDWLRVKYAIEKPSNKLLAAANTPAPSPPPACDGEVAAGILPAREPGLPARRECAEQRSRSWDDSVPSRSRVWFRAAGSRPYCQAGCLTPHSSLAAETLTLERTPSDLVNQAYRLTQAEVALMWQRLVQRPC